jgi:predicted RecB family nuclease
MSPITLSKSRFLLGLQCPKWLYLAVHQPELIPPPDTALQALFDRGHQVGLLATELYAGGAMVAWGKGGYQGAVEKTEALLKDRHIPALFEAAFEVDGLRVKADILARRSEDTWDLLEVKQGTKVKDVNAWDVAFQKYVLNKVGLEARDVYLVHLNRQYVYPGGKIDLDQLFIKALLTDTIAKRIKAVPQQIDTFQSVLLAGKVPPIDVGPHCKTPFVCPLWDHCTANKPKHWAQTLYGLSQGQKEQLEAMGVQEISDIPQQFELSPIQRRIKDVLVSGKPHVDPQVKTLLGALKKPIHYLDFETFMTAIPLYPGTRPYDTIAFQWSLHTENDKGDVTHQAFLAENKDDPRPEFVQRLLAAINAVGSILIYTNYETRILRALIPVVPDHAHAIRGLIDRCVDLCAMVRDHVYHPEFYQSFSLKTVLPAVLPDMAHDDLEIQDGETASVSFLAMLDERDLEKKAKLRRALLDYCERDTMAMVALKRYCLEG